MTSTLLIKSCGVNNFEWLHLEGGNSTVVVGDIDRLAEAVIASQSSVLIVSTKSVAFRQVGFESGERKILSQTIPYTLEDDLIEDVEKLHFALGSPANNTVPVAIVSRDDIDASLSLFKEEQVDIQQAVAELFLIPRQELSWSLLIEEDCWTVRTSYNSGVSVKAGWANLALQLLLDESEQLPTKLDIYGAGQAQLEVSNKLPELLRGITQWRSDDYWVMVENAYSGANNSTDTDQNTNSGPAIEKFTPINFLQGPYARQLPWLKWWKTWRVTSALLIVATAGSLLSSYIKVSTLEQKNIELRTQIEQVYRSVVPKGAIFDAEKQLRRKVSSVKGSGGEGFISLFDQIAAVLVQTKGLTLQSLNYTGSQSEVRMTVIAEDFVDVEKTRSKLEEIGLNAELTGSSTEGNKTRARLKIRG